MDVTLSPRARTTLVWIAAGLALLLLIEAAHALAPFAWAIVTAYLLHPFVAMLSRRTRLPRQLVAIWVYLVIALVVVFLAINLTPQLVQQLQDLQRVKIPSIIDEIDAWFRARQASGGAFATLDPDFVRERLDLAGDELGNLLSTEAVSLLLSTFTFAIELFFYLIASFYLIVYGDTFVAAVRDSLNRRYHREFDKLLLDVNSTLGAYLRGQLTLFLIMSISSYIALRVLDVDYALSLALATGLLELIPLIGPWTAGTIAVTIALFQDTTPFGWSNVTLGIVVGLVYFALRQLEDAFVIPLVIGRFVHLHPLLVIFVLVIGTSIGGVLGLLLAVPVAAVLKIVIAFFYAKFKAREVRVVETIPDATTLRRLVARFPTLANARVVLLIEPAALDWVDLPLVREVADAALDHAVQLEAVTPDGVAGSLATACGIPTVTVPMAARIDLPELAAPAARASVSP